jgi:hypothetical protein
MHDHDPLSGKYGEKGHNRLTVAEMTRKPTTRTYGNEFRQVKHQAIDNAYSLEPFY